MRALRVQGSHRKGFTTIFPYFGQRSSGGAKRIVYSVEFTRGKFILDADGGYQKEQLSNFEIPGRNIFFDLISKVFLG